MKKIVKGRAPRLLTQYKAQPGAEYDGPNFTPTVKNKIKEQLLEEQGFLCAYCMKRISFDEMKVEHFKCQHSFTHLQLDYTNLLGCCMGNEGNRPVNQTCDTRKGSRALNFSPIDSNFERLIDYNSSGKLTSIDPTFNQQINDVLNLNLKRLVDNRKAALTGLKRALDSRKGNRTSQELESYLAKYRGKNKDGKYKEYVGYLTDYLEKKIRKAK